MSTSSQADQEFRPGLGLSDSELAVGAAGVGSQLWCQVRVGSGIRDILKYKAGEMLQGSDCTGKSDKSEMHSEEMALEVQCGRKVRM